MIVWVMRSSRVPLRIAWVLSLAIGPLSCQSKQEDAPKPAPPAATASAEPGIIELLDGSPTVARLQTDRVALRPIRTALKAQAGKVLANENRLAHLSARVPGRIVAVYADLGARVGSTPFPRTLGLRVSLPPAETPVSAAVGDCASVRCNQRDPLWLQPWSGTAAGSPARA